MNDEHRHWRHHRSEGTSQPDRLDDLRAQLPKRFCDFPDDQIALLWVAWDAARHGHSAHYLTGVLAVPSQLAEQLISLAQSENDDIDDTPPPTST